MRYLPLILLLASSTALAQKAGNTSLLEDELATGKRKKIDASADDLGAALEAAMGSAASFSTKELVRVSDRIRAELRRDRPRATPKLLLFLYPGKVSVERLRSLAEVLVDIEVIIDPCERAVCDEALAKHIEVIGRAVGKPVITAPTWRLVFKTVTIKAETTVRGDPMRVAKIGVVECIAAAEEQGGGGAWMAAQRRAVDEYEPLMIQAIHKEAGVRRVVFSAPPTVTRTETNVDVLIKIKGDRARAEQQVGDALLAVGKALKSSSATPAQGKVDVTIEVPQRGVDARRFRAPAQQVALFGDGRIDRTSFWDSYVEEARKPGEATALSFSDDDAKGKDDAPPADDNAALAVLAANFESIAACVRGEALLNENFTGVTIGFKWMPTGQAEKIEPLQEKLRGGPLAKCLEAALLAIRFPRFSGEARTVEYPLFVK